MKQRRYSQQKARQRAKQERKQAFSTRDPYPIPPEEVEYAERVKKRVSQQSKRIDYEGTPLWRNQ
jgi:hypothetical protein